MIEVERQGQVCVLRMTQGENRMSQRFLDAFHAALDEAEKSEGPAALVTTGTGKFYSNGIDLDWLLGEGAAQFEPFLKSFQGLFARLVAFPLPTVAALNGHAFAGGALLALAHDFRVMRAERGYFCLPEIDLKILFRPGMLAMIQARLPSATAHEAVLTGRRYGGEEARACGIVDAVVPEAEVLPRAIERAETLAGKDRATLAAFKRGLYKEVLELLEA